MSETSSLRSEWPAPASAAERAPEAAGPGQPLPADSSQLELGAGSRFGRTASWDPAKSRHGASGDEQGARGPRGSDLLCCHGGADPGVPRLPLRAGRASVPRTRHRGSAAAPTEQGRSQLRARVESAGIGLRESTRRSWKRLRWLRPGSTKQTTRLQRRLARTARTGGLTAYSSVARACCGPGVPGWIGSGAAGRLGSW